MTRTFRSTLSFFAAAFLATNGFLAAPAAMAQAPGSEARIQKERAE